MKDVHATAVELYEKYCEEMPTTLAAYAQTLMDLGEQFSLKPHQAKKILDEAIEGDTK